MGFDPGAVGGDRLLCPLLELLPGADVEDESPWSLDKLRARSRTFFTIFRALLSSCLMSFFRSEPGAALTSHSREFHAIRLTFVTAAHHLAVTLRCRTCYGAFGVNGNRS